MVDAGTRLAPRHLDQLRRSCADIVTADDAGYDDARRLWNAIHDRRPAVIARPRNAQEVAAAVAFAREHDLEIAVQSGGHAAAGLAGRDGGLVVNLSNMRGVEVDPRSRIARANGGALLGELDIAAQAHGLVCPVGVVGHTGVAGLTLGGGIGRLQRHFGLTIDNLAAVELVTADGRLVRATENDEPELFWGLRGAGWNFGIATAFEFRLQPFGPDLHRGVLTFPAGQVQEIWGIFRDFAAGAPDALSLIFGVARAGADEGYPDDVVGRPIAYIAWNHSGSADDAERDTAALRDGPKPLTTTIGSHAVPRGPDRRTTSRSPGAAARSSRATTGTASGRKRSTRWSSSFGLRPGTRASRSRPSVERSAVSPRTRPRMPVGRRRST